MYYLMSLKYYDVYFVGQKYEWCYRIPREVSQQLQLDKNRKKCIYAPNGGEIHVGGLFLHRIGNKHKTDCWAIIKYIYIHSTLIFVKYEVENLRSHRWLPTKKQTIIRLRQYAKKIWWFLVDVKFSNYLKFTTNHNIKFI